MSAQQQTCYTLVCDECHEQVYGHDEGPYHFESVQALRFDAQKYNNWTQDGDRDLCPSCTCSHAGHRKKIGNSGFVYCDRCDETLLNAITATPSAAYL